MFSFSSYFISLFQTQSYINPSIPIFIFRLEFINSKPFEEKRAKTEKRPKKKKKNSKASSFLCFALLLLFSSSTNAFNITKILSQYSDFSNFNDLLTQTHLAGEINSRQTVTVLVVENGAISSINGKPSNVIKDILSNHIILDYYDVSKFNKLTKKSTILTTLYQSTGQAENQQGFLNCTVLGQGEIAFGSAVKGASIDSRLVKTVTSQPYNISVVQVSQAIVAPGIASKARTPGQAPTKAPSPDSNETDAPESAATPPKKKSDDDDEVTVPVSSPPEPESAADDAPAPSESGASCLRFFGVGALMGLASILVIL
ncbi:Fasciclin-like arabinogalactan protein [Quillaja saponaria]|uniref:Fasciclin-like arabinogalactan protein n=1 Tax=Quillaja saponaria TaxID=32244 RepID=A0AAD7LXG7_QUISA|nr:Fasciclin-like arabinogalactan protein [Quillaja saponaria]